MHGLRLAALLALLAAGTTGCYATKVVSVPMRLTGAVASVVPFVGNGFHDAIDEVADEVDDLP